MSRLEKKQYKKALPVAHEAYNNFGRNLFLAKRLMNIEDHYETFLSFLECSEQMEENALFSEDDSKVIIDALLNVLSADLELGLAVGDHLKCDLSEERREKRIC